ncbi:MAG: menaquinone biosynthesis protein [Desulfovibrionales bacterium]|nr:menaquinone biosynthesis protein [Desulfovibrionales bacterium]
MALRIGRIDYLNIWHVFHLLADICPEGPDFLYEPGHPSHLNSSLANGTLDISPSSSFEYLLHAEKYRLLPGASINARSEVQSVLFLSPVTVEELPAWLALNPGPVCLTKASATSTSLLRVLWSQKWNLAEPHWQEVEPGTGLATGRPFLEIGNLALRHFVQPPAGYHVYDLAREWTSWTGLPAVFAVWIVRRGLPEPARNLVRRLGQGIMTITSSLEQHFERLCGLPELPHWLNSPELLCYWRAMSYDLGPQERAGLALFGERCTRQGLLPGMPALSWFSS